MLDFGFYNMDCMDGMKEFPDKYFDLAIVDPPYGGSEAYTEGKRFGGRFEKYKPKINVERAGGRLLKYGNRNAIDWDVAPSSDYFMFDECGYEGEGIGRFLHCTNCGAEIEHKVITDEVADE